MGLVERDWYRQLTRPFQRSDQVKGRPDYHGGRKIQTCVGVRLVVYKAVSRDQQQNSQIYHNVHRYEKNNVSINNLLSLQHGYEFQSAKPSKSAKLALNSYGLYGRTEGKPHRQQWPAQTLHRQRPNRSVGLAGYR